MYSLQLTQPELLAIVNASVRSNANFEQRPNETLTNLVNKLKGLTK